MMTGREEDTEKGHTYRAFISYSHKDKAIASWLHKQLENFRMPKQLIGKVTSLGEVPKRLTPIFRDQDELPASGNLGAELENALARSQFLIVICSPASAQSKWVDEEIRRFKMRHGSDKVLSLIVDGEPNPLSNVIKLECFPPSLKVTIDTEGVISDSNCEPIAADLRTNADGKRLAILKIISGLTGLRLDELVQREAARRTKTLLQISAGSLIAAIFAIGLALYANDQRMVANTQQAIAEQEAANARAVSDFLVESFSNTISFTENPSTVTARSILDRGAQRISTQLKEQPLIQARLSATIASAFNNLGLFEQAIQVIDNTVTFSGKELPEAFIVKAQSLYLKGQLEDSLATLKYAELLFEKESMHIYTTQSSIIRSDIAYFEALVYYQLGKHEDSLVAFETVIRELEGISEPNEIDVAKVLSGRALLLMDMGELEEARLDLENAMKNALAAVGNEDIMVAQIAQTQAQVDFLSWNLEPALEEINFAITNMKRILEENHPILADAISMKGQILQAMGELDEAYAALTEAVEIYTNAYKGRHYLSGIAEVYLGLIAGGKQDLPAALAHFEEAKLHYDAGYGGIHANHGDLLVNQATVLASNGELARAKQDCADGMVILEDTLGKDAAFTQQLQAVCDDIYAQ